MRAMRQGVIAAALVCALAGAAHADDKGLARESYSAGKRHYDLGEYPEALAAFEKAYLNYEEPVFLYNIALCYRQLGDRQAAIRSYRTFLDNWPKAPNRASVEHSIALLEQEIAREANPAPKPAVAAAPATPPPSTAPAPKPAATAQKPATTTTPAATPSPSPSTAPKTQVASAQPVPKPATEPARP